VCYWGGVGAEPELGATGGYLIGFILAALFIGYVTDKYIKSRHFISMLGVMAFASLFLIYVPGVIWLGIWLKAVSGVSVSIISLLAMGVAPFIVGDIIKCVAGALITKTVTPKKDYTGNNT